MAYFGCGGRRRLFSDRLFVSDVPIPLGVSLLSFRLVSFGGWSQGKPTEIIPRLKAGWWDSLLLNWKIWVPCQLVNFRFVPQNYQVLFANFVALIWNTGLSFIANKKEETSEKKAA